ncbi:MAG: CarD family transcriptional regulator [Myxococcota bacterium]|jgi:CarD family transcriptional regulator
MNWEARIGKLAVYPGYGVARIEALQQQEVGGQNLEFLVLRRLEDETRILIPRNKLDEVGLRSVMKRAEAARVWEILRTRTKARRRGGIPWSRQFREFQEKLRTGSIFDTAEVLRDLLRLQLEKELSFGERKLLENARSLLVQELAATQGVEADKVEADIRVAVRH